MKDKIISWILWITLWWIIIFWYWYFIWWKSDNLEKNTTEVSKKEISDEQIKRIANRSWLSESEIQSRLESWETMRDITWWWNGGWTWDWTWGSDFNKE